MTRHAAASRLGAGLLAGLLAVQWGVPVASAAATRVGDAPERPGRLSLPGGSEIWLCDHGVVLTGDVLVGRDAAGLRLGGRDVCAAADSSAAGAPAPELAPFVAWCEESHARVRSGEQSEAAWLDQVRERMRSGPLERVLAVEKDVRIGDGVATVYVRMEDGVARPFVIVFDDGRLPGAAKGGRDAGEVDALVADLSDYLRTEPDMPHLVVIRGCAIIERALGTRAGMMIDQLAAARRDGAAAAGGLVPGDILADMLRKR